jgi:septum formation protein
VTLVLASTSRYRATLLRRITPDVLVLDPGLDETPWQARNPPPMRLVTELAEAKARAAADRPDCPRGAWVIGADQTAELDGALLHKPGSRARAIEQLLRLAGREHRLWTAVCVFDTHTATCHAFVDVCRMIMRPFSEAEAEAYVRAYDPTDCAGSYRIEDGGISLFERVVCDDPTAIEGLPLMRLASVLRTLERERDARVEA